MSREGLAVSLFSRSLVTYSVAQLSKHPLTVAERTLNIQLGERLHMFELSELRGDGEVVLKCGQFDAKLDRLQLRPTLLDRPLALALERPLHVSSGATIQLSLSRPIAFEVVVSNATQELTLLSCATRALRLTSYGQVTSPMICYHWRSPADVTLAREEEALVPLLVTNHTKHPVELKKVILYKSFLKLFRAEAQFVTNQVQVMITAKSEAYVEYSERPPQALGECVLSFDPKHEGELPLLKILRLVGKKGTGIEYGF